MVIAVLMYMSRSVADAPSRASVWRTWDSMSRFRASTRVTRRPASMVCIDSVC